MAKYSVIHSCGHTQEHQIYGTNVAGERERKAEWLATQPCRECAAKERLARARAEAGAVVDLESLPPLTGSEKQVAWATDLRIHAIARIVREVSEPQPVRRMLDAIYRPELLQSARWERVPAERRGELIDMLVAAAATQTAAKWWIDGRDDPATAALALMTERQRSTILGWLAEVG